jgi:carboxyl-terminal processing protease
METGENNKKAYLVGVLIGLVISLIVVAGIVSVSKFRLHQAFAAKVEDMLLPSGSTVVSSNTLEKIREIEKAIDDNYYQPERDIEKEADNVYKGIVEALGDPYSEYYNAEEYEDLMTDTKGVYFGIGAYVSMDKELNLPRITGTIVDSPAEAAGFKANDIIYKVDGQSVQGLTLQEAVSMIRGEKGTSVVLTIYREGESNYLDIEVTRDEVKTQTVNTTMMEDGIGYLGITEFDSVTPEQFNKGMEELRSQDMKALIIDLRSNPGGVLSAVCEVAEQLLPKGVIVYTIDRDGNRVDNNCSGEHEIDIPVVVLVNGYSASAAEILSGAMKDYGKATLVGETTYGKGVVQRIFKFDDGTAIKLTISSYYTPNGTNINGVGIEPDVKIELDTESYAKDGSDNQLDKAVEILQKELKK